MNKITFFSILLLISNAHAFKVDTKTVRLWHDGGTDKFVVRLDEACQKYNGNYFSIEDSDIKKLKLNLVNQDQLQNIILPIFKDKNIAFKHLESDCETRAHLMSLKFDESKINSAKIFIEDELIIKKPETGEYIRWGYHVASIILVKENDKLNIKVIDPSLFEGPVSIESWTCKMVGHNSMPSFVISFTNRFHYSVFDRQDSMEAYNENDIRTAIETNAINLSLSH